MTIIPRRDWAPDGRDPAWKSDGQTRRPTLNLPLGRLIVHYTGVTSRTYIGSPVEPALDSLWQWAFGVGEKGDEYNYVIGWDGSTWEWAGRSQGAHCSNLNSTSIGVLLMLAEGEEPPDALVDAFQALRVELVAGGVLVAHHDVDQHGQHFATSCPGSEVKEMWARFDTPLTEPTPPTPAPPSRGAMLHITAPGRNPTLIGAGFVHAAVDDEEEYVMGRLYGPPEPLNAREYDVAVAMHTEPDN